MASKTTKLITAPPPMVTRPSRAEAEAAVRTLISWAGDDVTRDGLHETPSRVVRAYEEYFRGYEQDPEEILNKTFEEIEGYDEMIVLRSIRFESHCEHHMRPSSAAPGWLHSKRPCRRYFEARSSRRSLCKTPAD